MYKSNLNKTQILQFEASFFCPLSPKSLHLQIEKLKET